MPKFLISIVLICSTTVGLAMDEMNSDDLGHIHGKSSIVSSQMLSVEGPLGEITVPIFMLRHILLATIYQTFDFNSKANEKENDKQIELLTNNQQLLNNSPRTYTEIKSQQSYEINNDPSFQLQMQM